MSPDRAWVSLLALTVVGLGLHGAWRGEFRPRRHWGDVGGPREFAPITGRRARALAAWLVTAGSAWLAWVWLG